MLVQSNPRTTAIRARGRARQRKRRFGKTTTALHIAVALLKAGQRVATIDLDSRQQSFTHYIRNRRAWPNARIKLELPTHMRGARRRNSVESQRGAGVRQFLGGDRQDRATATTSWWSIRRQRHLSDAAGAFDGRHAGHAAQRLVRRFRRARHARSDQFTVTGESHYAEMVREARRQRRLVDAG